MRSSLFEKGVAIAVSGLLFAAVLVWAQLSLRFGSPTLITANQPGTQVFRETDSGGERAGNNGMPDSVELQQDRVVYPNAEAAFICGPQLKAGSSLNPAPWFDSTGLSTGTVLGEKYMDDTYLNTASQYNDFYYDLALIQYLNYYRTGDPKFQTYARRTADMWWRSQWIGNGTVTGGDNNLPPRSMAHAGLMLRALDGRPEMWDYLQRQIDTTFTLWLHNHRGESKLYYDLREDGYAQLYAVLLAKVLPDSYSLYGNGTLKASTGKESNGAAKRASYLARTEDTAVNFFGRLQLPDGSWRNNVEEDGVMNVNIEQPLMTGLYLESAILLHQVTANESVKTNLISQLTKSVKHLYNDAYDRNPVPGFPAYRWRGMFYYWGGGTVADPNKYNPPRPRKTACGLSLCGDGSVTMARHLNSTIHHAFGYAYFVTGDSVYKTMGDEVFDASYGDQVDSIHSLAGSGKGKDYAMNYRASGRYLVWRLATAPRPQALTRNETATPRVVSAQNYQRNLAQRLAACLVLAKSLAARLSDKEQIQDLISQIESTRQAVKDDKDRAIIAKSLLEELEGAEKHARTALMMTEKELGPQESAKSRIGWAAARLKRAQDMLKLQPDN